MRGTNSFSGRGTDSYGRNRPESLSDDELDSIMSGADSYGRNRAASSLTGDKITASGGGDSIDNAASMFESDKYGREPDPDVSGSSTEELSGSTNKNSDVKTGDSNPINLLRFISINALIIWIGSAIHLVRRKRLSVKKG